MACSPCPSTRPNLSAFNYPFRLTPDQTSAPADTPKPGPSNLQLRTIYGLLGAALLVGSVWFSPWTFGLFFAFVQAVMLWEFYRMMRAGGYAPATWLGMGVSLLLFATILFDNTLHVSSSDFAFKLKRYSEVVMLGCGLLLPTVLLIRAMLNWSGKEQHDISFANVGVTLLGVFYVGLPMSLLSIIAYPSNPDFSREFHGYDYRRVIVLLFLIWSSDIGAYAAGKTFGKHKLAPKISPGKTWEGFAGGVVLTLAMGWALGYLIPELPLAHRLVAAGVVAVFGPLGDLAESMLKRSVGVKDSGRIMPGHGGLLDRFDAFLLVLPVLVLLQLLF